MKPYNIARIAPLLIVPVLGIVVALVNACASETTEDSGESGGMLRNSYSDDDYGSSGYRSGSR